MKLAGVRYFVFFVANSKLFPFLKFKGRFGSDLSRWRKEILKKYFKTDVIYQRVRSDGV